MAIARLAEELKVGDMFTAPPHLLGGGTFTVSTVRKARSALNPAYHDEQVLPDRMYLDLTDENGDDLKAWFWPNQTLEVLPR